jgi:hypothetical protein
LKGTYFQQPLEFNVWIDGESWYQGKTISGILKVKNHGAELKPLSDVGVKLAFAQAKKVKAKDAECFDISTKAFFDPSEAVAQGEEKELPWSFTLPEDAHITEKNASQYLLYGTSEGIWLGGQLELNILPHPFIQSFFEIFETFFRFKVKELKNKKGLIDAKMVAPQNRDYANIKSLNCQIKHSDSHLIIKYIFKLKKIDYLENEMKMKEETQKMDFDLSPKDYLMFGKDIDQTKVEAHLRKVLDNVVSIKKF